jgi:hypothetical protein
MDERINVKILGRTIGTAIGWDQVADEVVFFYDFASNGKNGLPNGGLQFDYLSGTIEVIAEDGRTIVETHDVIAFFKDVPADK